MNLQININSPTNGMVSLRPTGLLGRRPDLPPFRAKPLLDGSRVETLG